MNEKMIKKEFENRNLKKENTNLLNTNTLLKRQLNTLKENFDNKLEKATDNKIKLKDNEINKLKKIVNIKEDENQRLEKKLAKEKEKNQKLIDKKDAEIEALKQKLIEQAKELNLTKKERDEYLAKLNLDGTTAGIPTSQTPINKNKIIPNTREKSTKERGGQKGHEKHKLERFNDDEINEREEITLNECPHCHSKNLKELDTSVNKDELDYEVRIIKKRISYKEYECEDCHKIVREKIPNNLKEDNQYGSKVQAHALSLTNVANVPFNKTRRIITGLSSNEINLSEGYIAKLQKRASNSLKDFIKDLKNYITTLEVIHWDDTVIFVNKKRACLRFYGDNKIALYTAHETKSKKGLDEDGILKKLSKEVKVVHDHNKVNYNEEYVYVNVECCQHLERDLEKVRLNITESTWSKKLKELFSSYNHKRNEYIKSGIESFSFEETNDFMIEFDECILLGTEEHKKHGNSHYYNKEKALLTRLIEYRDNYTYWLYDFSIPYTNNTSERGLRGVKTKMKVSGQFSNIDYGKYYANIRSYTETCHRNGINEIEALTRLAQGNPYTLDEILEIGNSKNND